MPIVRFQPAIWPRARKNNNSAAGQFLQIVIISLLYLIIFSKLKIMARLLSLFLFFCFLGCSNGASNSANKSPDLYIRSGYTTNADYDLQRYLNGIAARISKDNDLFIKENCEAPGSFSVTALNSEEAFSLITPSGFIYLSTGLISKLKSEDELAFVLAHEISHRLLCHDYKEEQPHLSQQNEISADTLAIKIIYAVNYNPGAGISALSHAYSAYSHLGDNESHPDLSLRIKNIGLVLQEFDDYRLRPLTHLSITKSLSLVRTAKRNY